MRLIILIGAIIFSRQVVAQEIFFNPDSVSYHMADTGLRGAKSDLHRKAQGWVIDNFHSSTETFRLDDMDTGELTGKGTIPLKGAERCTVSFKVSSRDRAYECIIHDIVITASSHDGGKDYSYFLTGGKKTKKAAERVDSKIRSILQDLHKRMISDKNYSTPSPSPLD